MGKPYQAIRGFYWGKKREKAKTARYRLARMFDSDGTPVLPMFGGGKFKAGYGHHWSYPDKEGFNQVMIETPLVVWINTKNPHQFPSNPIIRDFAAFSTKRVG